jgi:hypothetical protein
MVKTLLASASLDMYVPSLSLERDVLTCLSPKMPETNRNLGKDIPNCFRSQAAAGLSLHYLCVSALFI